MKGFWFAAAVTYASICAAVAVAIYVTDSALPLLTLAFVPEFRGGE